MFIILLEFSANKSQAGEFMQGHNDWIKKALMMKFFWLSAV